MRVSFMHAETRTRNEPLRRNLHLALMLHIFSPRRLDAVLTCVYVTHTRSHVAMPTSTRFVVAVHTLAINSGPPMRSQDIASSANTNPTVIRSLLSRLSEAGLTTSQLGTGGGALL